MKKRIVIIVLLAAAATGIWLWRSGRFSKESNRILVSGNLEMTQVDLSFRIAGRLTALNVREGSLNAMHFAYFADSLMDSTVREMLAPYVVQKVA